MNNAVLIFSSSLTTAWYSFLSIMKQNTKAEMKTGDGKKNQVKKKQPPEKKSTKSTEQPQACHPAGK